jgi:gliding motility-associated-like protein
MKIFYLLFLFVFSLANAQSDVPVTLRAQFNGSFGYTIIGNTLNEFDNYQSPQPACQMLTQSSATLNLLPNQTIVAAYLYWGGIGDGTFNPTIKLNTTSYNAAQTFVADPFGSQFVPYFNSYVDVTNQVVSTGNGTYTLSNINLNPIISDYCPNGIYNLGWHIVVVYLQANLLSNQINIYDGLNVVSDQFNSGTTPLSINNLNVVSAQNAKMTYVALNGSPNLFFNESIIFNGNTLSNVLNPANNPFNGTNSFTGSNTNWNQDIDTFDISPFINIGDTQASITLKSAFMRGVQTVVTSIRSELPDATVLFNTVSGQNVCNNRSLVVNYTVKNTNSNAPLPANVPVSFYANNVLLSTVNTPTAIAIGGTLPLQTIVNIPLSVSNTFNLRVVVDNNAANASTIAESNENNNEASQSISLASNNINSIFSIQNTFCQGAIVPTLPNTSNNGIIGTWSPTVISNQNSGAYIFTPNVGQCAVPFTQNVTISNSITPSFSLQNTFCQGATVPTLPNTSNNGITGTWSPTVISNQNSGTYIFTPNVGQCAVPFTQNVTISNSITPSFSIQNTFCQGATVPTLPNTSNNGITGTWSPTVISNQNSGAYIFTPNVGQCAVPFTQNVTISNSITPSFSLQNTFCQGATVPTLPNTSNNGITGTWSPTVISNQNSGTYIFTPNVGQCAVPFTQNVTISNSITPSFSIQNTFCQGATVPTLPNTSNNGITGTWSPTFIDNQNSGSYTFTPATGGCTVPFVLNVTISNNILPFFSLANSFCAGATVPVLPTISSNNISGTWSPTVIDNQNSGAYVFTPAVSASNCALPFVLNVTISPNIASLFSIPNTFCSGTTVPVLPTISSNGIVGTWSPAVINNQNSGSYVFTPTTNATTCALPFTLNVTISPNVLSTFSIANSFCFGETVPILPSISNNNISGTWSPAVIDNQNSGAYVFTPNAGQCAVPFTQNVTISNSITPSFSLQNTLCQGSTVPILPSTSNNGILGSWLPTVINNQNSGLYVFTPNVGQCANSFNLNVIITPGINPIFSLPNSICEGAVAPVLPATSTNNISGTWSPTAIDNQNNGAYIFTPNAGQCAVPFTLNFNIITQSPIVENLFVCNDTQSTNIASAFLDSGLNPNDYVFVWSLNNQPIAQNTAAILVVTEGNYRLVATPNGADCPKFFEFIVSALQPITAKYVVSDDFAVNQTIAVEAFGGSGQYLYSFDSLPFQNHPIFSVIDGGDILVKIVDSSNCYALSKVITLWQYPRFFTPNNDSYNDTWGIKTQKMIRIDVFDRFGKLIKQLKNSERWDGTFNSQPLPADDYWFVLFYDEGKIFKGHFSLKR